MFRCTNFWGNVILSNALFIEIVFHDLIAHIALACGIIQVAFVQLSLGSSRGGGLVMPCDSHASVWLVITMHPRTTKRIGSDGCDSIWVSRHRHPRRADLMPPPEPRSMPAIYHTHRRTTMTTRRWKHFYHLHHVRLSQLVPCTTGHVRS